MTETRKPAPPTGPSKPIEYRQLCALAREQFLAEPTMADDEWVARIKERLVQFGFAYPRPDQITTAMAAVSAALAKTIGPRPVRMPPTVPVSAPAVPDLPKPTPEEWARMARIVRSLLPRVQAPAAGIAPPPRETVQVSESELLTRFYTDARMDRLGALKLFAEIAIVRGDDWDPEKVRREHEAEHKSPFSQPGCFGCLSRSRQLVWHHVIQIQHGGSNHPRNLVAICKACHAAVHPWMPEEQRSSLSGWKWIGDIDDREGFYEELLMPKGKRA